jgi:hypothetical protein
MKKILSFMILLLLMFSSISYGAGEPIEEVETSPKRSISKAGFLLEDTSGNVEAGFIEPKKVVKVDPVLEDFSKGKLGDNWWIFGALKPDFVKPEDEKIGTYAMKLMGRAEDWYVGGGGFYVAKDAGGFDAIEFWLEGNGPKSGKMKIELFDDDNGNREIEQDDQFNPINDDRFEYQIKVTWLGWKKVVIPFGSFSDANPGIGNDVLDPDSKDGSGGLIQMQYIFNASSQTGEVRTGLGTIKLVKLDLENIDK